MNDGKSDTDRSLVQELTPKRHAADIKFHAQQLAVTQALAERIKLLMLRSRSK